MTSLDIVAQPADQLPGAALAVLLFEDQRPLAGPVAVVDWRLDGLLTRMILGEEIAGRPSEHLILQSNGKIAAPWVLVIGGGRWQNLDGDVYRRLLRKIFMVAGRAGMADLALCIPPHEQVSVKELQGLSQEVLDAFHGINHCCFSTVTGFS